jgi:type I restriction-modification system DNA methylase subunit
MKTPIQEFYNFMNQHQYFIGNDLFKKYHELLDKEKEAIKRAYKQGVVDEYGDTIDLDTITEAEEYYNKTFNTKKK